MDCQVVCIIGVSGAGKTSLVQRLKVLYPDLYREPISATTRPMRDGEVDGVDYHFLDRPTFEQWIADDKLVENATYNGNYYGTPLSELQTPGMIALHVVEDAGAISLRGKILARVVGVLPPSDEERMRRLQLRGDSPAAVAQRIAADSERSEVIRSIADFVIINDDLTIAADILHRHITADLSLSETPQV